MDYREGRLDQQRHRHRRDQQHRETDVDDAADAGVLEEVLQGGAGHQPNDVAGGDDSEGQRRLQQAGEEGIAGDQVEAGEEGGEGGVGFDVGDIEDGGGGESRRAAAGLDLAHRRRRGDAVGEIGDIAGGEDRQAFGRIGDCRNRRDDARRNAGDDENQTCQQTEVVRPGDAFGVGRTRGRHAEGGGAGADQQRHAGGNETRDVGVKIHFAKLD